MMVYDPFGVIGVKIKVMTCSFHVTEKREEKMGLRFLTNFFLEDKKAKRGIFYSFGFGWRVNSFIIKSHSILFLSDSCEISSSW